MSTARAFTGSARPPQAQLHISRALPFPKGLFPTAITGSESIAVKLRNVDIVHTDPVARSVATTEHNLKQIRPRHRLEEGCGGIPRTRLPSGHAAGRRHTALGILVRIANHHSTVVVCGRLELVVHGDGVVATRAHVHGLGKGLAADAAGVGTRPQDRGEGVVAAIVGAPGAGEGIGGGAEETGHAPSGTGVRGRAPARFEAAILNDGAAGTGRGRGGEGQSGEHGEGGKYQREMHLQYQGQRVMKL